MGDTIKHVLKFLHSNTYLRLNTGEGTGYLQFAEQFNTPADALIAFAHVISSRPDRWYNSLTNPKFAAVAQRVRVKDVPGTVRRAREGEIFTERVVACGPVVGEMFVTGSDEPGEWANELDFAKTGRTDTEIAKIAAAYGALWGHGGMVPELRVYGVVREPARTVVEEIAN